MTVAGGRRRLPPAQLRDGGRVSVAKLDPRARRAASWSTSRRRFARRSPTSTTSPRRPATLVRGRRGDRRPGRRHRAVPEGARRDRARGRRAPARRRRAAREGVLLGRGGRRLRPRRPRPGARLRDRDPRLRQPDRARPARRGHRGPRRRATRSAPAPTRTSALGLHKMEARGGADQRRDGAVRAAAAAPAPTSSRKCRRWS